MKFLIKNKFFSLGQNSVVLDEELKEVYKVKGSFFSNKISRTYKKKIKDMQGKKLFIVRNKFWHRPFHKSAIIFDKDGRKLAVVKKSHIIKNGYEVVGATEPINIEGSGWNLQIMLGDKNIGQITPPEVNSIKDVLRLSDAYCIDVFDAEDAPFMIAMMIAIDNIYDQERRS